MSKITLEDLLKLLSKYEIKELEGVKIEGDVEIELESEQNSQPQVQVQPPKEEEIKLLEKKFEPYKEQWSGYVEEVQLGATPKEGGTRKYTIKLGGEKSLPFYIFDAPQPNLPSVSIDVFDRPVPLPKTIKVYYEDVMGHPDEWAKKVIKEFNSPHKYRPITGRYASSRSGKNS